MSCMMFGVVERSRIYGRIALGGEFNIMFVLGYPPNSSIVIIPKSSIALKQLLKVCCCVYSAST